MKRLQAMDRATNGSFYRSDEADNWVVCPYHQEAHPVDFPCRGCAQEYAEAGIEENKRRGEMDGEG